MAGDYYDPHIHQPIMSHFKLPNSAKTLSQLRGSARETKINQYHWRQSSPLRNKRKSPIRARKSVNSSPRFPSILYTIKNQRFGVNDGISLQKQNDGNRNVDHLIKLRLESINTERANSFYIFPKYLGDKKFSCPLGIRLPL